MSTREATRLVLYVSAAFGIAMVSHQVLYESLLVPRLPGLRRVPLPWWALVLSPWAVCAIFVSTRVRSAAQLLLAGITGGTVHHLLFTLFAMANRPGHGKALESTSWWVKHWLISVVVALFLLICGTPVAYLVRNRRRLLRQACYTQRKRSLGSDRQKER